MDSPKNGIMLRQGSMVYNFTKSTDTYFSKGSGDGVLHLGSFQMGINGGDQYEGTENIIPSVVATSAWQDFVIFPNNAATDNLDILIGIWAADGYQSTTGPVTGGGKMVYFQAEVKNVNDSNSKIAANKILRVSVKIKGAGSLTPETPDSYGSLDLNVSLSAWDDTPIDVSIEI